jgi:hypothetical protein
MAMRILDVDDPDRMRAVVARMRRNAWDLDRDFAWDTRIDVEKPLLPLAQIDRVFPGLAADERLVLSQLFGLVVAQIFSDAEQFLNEARERLWSDFERLFGAHPALLELGTQFFDEERKHAEMFRRYITAWLTARGLDIERFFAEQPRFSASWQHRVILRNAARGGLAFWWIVLLAEEESPLIYRDLEDAPDEIEPLYLQVHRKHFEEEARHATFAYTAMAYLADRLHGPTGFRRRSTDVMLAQAMQISFMAQAIAHRQRNLPDPAAHPWIAVVVRAMQKIRRLPPRHLFRVFFREPTLIGPFLNYRFHRNMVEMATTRRLWSLPLPRVEAMADSPVNALA